MWRPLLLLLAATTAEAHSASYCSTNNFNTNSSWMQFTKEPIPLEYGFEDKFKSIHCCGKGYRSIEWFKDNVAYPWSAGVSNLVLFPEAANQTLYTRRAARSDSGNYTCRISNETHSQQHTVRLEVLESAPDAPKSMFISKDQWVGEGGELRLYCEALKGRPYLADAPNDLRWRKVLPNDTEVDLLPTQDEIQTSRDDIEDIIGAYLVVRRVTPADIGTYVCAVHSNEVVSKSYVSVHLLDPLPYMCCATPTVPWHVLCISIAGVAALALSLVMIHRRCTARVLLALRIAHARATPAAQRARVLEKEFDVLVCWTAVDDSLVRGALLPTLTHKYKYRVHHVLLETQPHTWYKTLVGETSRCRSLLAVVSPAQYSSAQLLGVLSALRALPLPPVVALLQDLPKLKREAKEMRGSSLVDMLRHTRLVPWRHVHERAFWTELRLALPLPPRRLLLQNKTENPEEVDEAKESRSGSLTALV